MLKKHTFSNNYLTALRVAEKPHIFTPTILIVCLTACLINSGHLQFCIKKLRVHLIDQKLQITWIYLLLVIVAPLLNVYC